MRSATDSANKAVGYAESGADWVGVTAASMRRDARYRMAAADDAPRPGGGGEDPPDLGGEEPPDDAPNPPAPQPPPSRDVPWSERSVLELGPNFGETPVYPHPDANDW
jgi:hypothetical protein